MYRVGFIYTLASILLLHFFSGRSMAQDQKSDDQGYPGWQQIDWSEQNQLALGSVRDVVLNDKLPNIKPSALYEVTEDVGMILKIAILPDLKNAVVLIDRQDGPQLRLIKLESMEVVKNLHTQDYWSNNSILNISTDGNRIVYLGSPGFSINIFSAVGEQVATIGVTENHPDNPIAFCFGHDGNTLIVTFMDNRIREYSSLDGTLLRDIQVEYENTRNSFWPVLSDSDQLAVFLSYRDNDEKHLISVDLDRQVVVHDETVPTGLVVKAIDGKRFLVARINQQWEGYEIRDTKTLKIIQTVDMTPQMSSIGAAYHADRNVFLFLEYMIQPLVLFKADTGQPIGIIQPPGGGCAMFDTSNSGRSIVAVVGPWRNGTLLRSHVAIYDLDAFFAEKQTSNNKK